VEQWRKETDTVSEQGHGSKTESDNVVPPDQILKHLYAEKEKAFVQDQHSGAVIKDVMLPDCSSMQAPYKKSDSTSAQGVRERDRSGDSDERELNSCSRLACKNRVDHVMSGDAHGEEDEAGMCGELGEWRRIEDEALVWRKWVAVGGVTVMLYVMRVLRRWNQTGNKWLDLPDFGDWLVV
jgi:hypothetical protein